MAILTTDSVLNPSQSCNSLISCSFTKNILQFVYKKATLANVIRGTLPDSMGGLSLTVDTSGYSHVSN